jgi:hypothetical protein
VKIETNRTKGFSLQTIMIRLDIESQTAAETDRDSWPLYTRDELCNHTLLVWGRDYILGMAQAMVFPCILLCILVPLLVFAKHTPTSAATAAPSRIH